MAFIDLYLLLMSVDPYQSALKWHSDLGLHYLLRRSKLQYQKLTTDNNKIIFFQSTYVKLCNMLYYKYRLDCQVTYLNFRNWRQE